MKLKIVVVIVISVCSVWILGNRTIGDPIETPNISALKAVSNSEREAAAKNILQQRDKTQQYLQEIVGTSIKNPDKKAVSKTAIDLLGQLRATEAVQLLVENLTFEVFYKDAKRLQTVEDRLPCVGALINIGIPSLAPLVAKVSQTDDEVVARYSAIVMQKVLGKKLAVAYVDEALEQQYTVAEKQRLTRLRQLANTDSRQLVIGEDAK